MESSTIRRLLSLFVLLFVIFGNYTFLTGGKAYGQGDGKEETKTFEKEKIKSLALIPFTLIQGLGRPDVTAKFHLLELPLYAGLLWFLVSRMGIAGAALAWTLRTTLDAILMFGAAYLLQLVSVRALNRNDMMRSALVVLTLGMVLSLPAMAGQPLVIQTVIAAFVLTLFTVGVWVGILNDSERAFLDDVIGRLVGSFGRAR